MQKLIDFRLTFWNRYFQTGVLNKQRSLSAVPRMQMHVKGEIPGCRSPEIPNWFEKTSFTLSVKLKSSTAAKLKVLWRAVWALQCVKGVYNVFSKHLRSRAETWIMPDELYGANFCFFCFFFTVNKCSVHYETSLDYQHDCDFHFWVNFSFNWCNSLQQSATCWRWGWATVSLSCNLHIPLLSLLFVLSHSLALIHVLLWLS